MKKKYAKIPVKGDKALEMTMQDVLEGLEDAAGYFAFRSIPDTLEVLSIEPPKGDPVAERAPLATVYTVPQRRSVDIVDYLIARENLANGASA
ncbi:MAG: hypothetical protein OEZ39_03095 [Gammaproteobacteria bacterium]|nr:hypothetical protein [Gammaproteobacteria bacterium]MDH5650843.1 hypothetical protein [Gammaproteobacteria bacterium]